MHDMDDLNDGVELHEVISGLMHYARTEQSDDPPVAFSVFLLAGAIGGVPIPTDHRGIDFQHFARTAKVALEGDWQVAAKAHLKTAVDPPPGTSYDERFGAWMVYGAMAGIELPPRSDGDIDLTVAVLYTLAGLPPRADGHSDLTVSVLYTLAGLIDAGLPTPEQASRLRQLVTFTGGQG